MNAHGKPFFQVENVLRKLKADLPTIPDGRLRFAGTYTLSITYKDEHIPGSPFKIKVEGESILAYTLTSKVEIKGKALTSACKVNEVTKFEVDCQEKAIAAGLR